MVRNADSIENAIGPKWPGGQYARGFGGTDEPQRSQRTKSIMCGCRGSGNTDTPTKQYIWGTYIDECIQLNLLVAAWPQSVPAGAYYLLQDLLYRAAALTNSGGYVVEAYDTDAYGNTLIFTAPDTSGNWWGDAAVQSSYGANEIIYCGYRFDSETQLYYVRNRTYNPVLGRWIQRDPIGYAGGINLHEYVKSGPVGAADPSGLGRQGNYPSPPYPAPNWGHGYGNLIYNYELLKVKVCPADLANDIKAARGQLGQFSAFNQGNIANVRLKLIRGAIYADFDMNNLLLSLGSLLNGNDNLVRLIYGGQYLEAVTQNNHFLVGIRRWYVMPFSKDSFIVFTEAYERANGFMNEHANKWINIEAKTFIIWNTELIDVATWVKGMKGGAT